MDVDVEGGELGVEMNPVQQEAGENLEGGEESEIGDNSEDPDEAGPATKKPRKERDPYPPIAPAKLHDNISRAMHKFVKEVKSFNSRVPGDLYRASVYCCVIYDAPEKGDKLLRQGRPLTSGSLHIDEALRGSKEDVELHRLFQSRLVYHHTAQNGQTLSRLAAKLDPSDHAEGSPHAKAAPHAAHAHAEDSNLDISLIEPERLCKDGLNWDQRLIAAKEMMLDIFNMEHGSEAPDGNGTFSK